MNRLNHAGVIAQLVAKTLDVSIKSTASRGLNYLKARFPKVEAWQIAADGKKDYVSPEGIRVAPASVLLGQLV